MSGLTSTTPQVATGTILPFASQHTENLTPVFQADGVYGVNSFFNSTTTGLTTGAAGAMGSCFACLNTREDQ